MTELHSFPDKATSSHGDSALAERLCNDVEGDVLFDPASRGRYSTDASHYQIEPIGVVVPKTADDNSKYTDSDAEIPMN